VAIQFCWLDGEVNPAEFLGERDQFDKLDLNHDGLSSPDEAAAAEPPRYDIRAGSSFGGQVRVFSHDCKDFLNRFFSAIDTSYGTNPPWCRASSESDWTWRSIVVRRSHSRRAA
jgi:hypothetical protein